MALSQVDKIRSQMRIEKETPVNTTTFYHKGSFQGNGYDPNTPVVPGQPFDTDLKRKLKIKILELGRKENRYMSPTEGFKEVYNPNVLTFEMIGIDAAMANTLRRVMIAEVPTMAIETVVFLNNTSIIQDEVLAHRMALVPINADPRQFRLNKKRVLTKLEEEKRKQPEREEYKPPTYLFDSETILFRLKKKCHTDRKTGTVVNETVYSGDLEWIPIGDQATRFADNPIRPVIKDIPIAKLAPGQEIDAQIYCEKGIGKTHAKWSPVCTATYRLYPEVRMIQQPPNAQAFVQKCPMDVFDIEDAQVVVGNNRACTSCRECIREDDRFVELSQRKDHFIFSVESTGALSPQDIFLEATRIFYEKCDVQQKALQALIADDEETKGVIR